jgi:hypothetical protein
LGEDGGSNVGGVANQHDLFLTRYGIPHSCGTVPAGGKNPSAIAGESDGRDGRCMSFEDSGQLSLPGVPDPWCVTNSRRDNPAAIGRERNAGNNATLSLQ